MKKHAVKFIMVALIVSIALIGCDDAFQRVSQEDADAIAYAGVFAMMGSGVYIEAAMDDEPVDLSEIADITVDSSNLDNGIVEITWTNFDLGKSMHALFDAEGIPESLKPKKHDLIDEGLIKIINGSGTFDMSTGSIELTMTLKTAGLEEDGIPSGTYNVNIKMLGFGVDDESEEVSITVTVNGVVANFDMNDLDNFQ